MPLIFCREHKKSPYRPVGWPNSMRMDGAEKVNFSPLHPYCHRSWGFDGVNEHTIIVFFFFT